MKSAREKTSKRQRKSSSTKQFAKRLTCYTTAAGLGAFAHGETAQALVIYRDVNPDIAVTLIDLQQNLSGDYYIDMDSNGTDDFRIRYQIAGYDPAAIRFQGVGYSEELSNTDKGSNYYVRSFELGDSIGPGAVTTSTGYGIVAANYLNFGAVDTENYPQFAGIRLDIGGSTHYGWVRMQTSPVNYPGSGAPIPPLTATIFDWAYETDPDTAILAGDVGSFVPGDFDDDGDVDGNDLSKWMTDYSVNGGSDGDLDGDSDGRDFLIWQRNYTGPLLTAANSSVPEPTSLALLAAGGGALALKRRRRT
ncbi:PEP-CTERM sorting domain-containing protein [Bythopirellula polymerisocia]|uniref:PEP-CTERM motif protein n=1 Tax=Bythopirellula polymerisocia TaxID=2528003 RepID=A0A5C6CD95_9BACT|nr:PEP-CTERM sorting domain-containing protein [Bythopirellula polymerisocia]TWU20789.1 PEP-CTERM motif protein [Bythopirellula polymerisocia]